ncbi:hypothetical protein DFH07DRAFT_921185 [Mycena maculata]|uniref:Tetratricopeptide SHNi-TPR domain-containing protein n=1 Tax=Mycena maculata TaxID=230809 RepID=A0AAD7J1K1_9AGAR|nr:hypothetical protein DFH07DRAFT_921185 [Mycena maculata]
MADASSEMSLDAAIEHGQRAFALQKYEQAVDHYATALELMYVASLVPGSCADATKTHGDEAPEIADLYFAYGKALLENAITQSGVLGKDQPEGDAEEEAPESSADGPILSFSGDGDDEGDAVDLKNMADEEEAADDADADEGGDEEPEDDFNAAWEVLDLARAIYAKQTSDGQDGDDNVRLKLADTYIALGDVSLETEKFDAAITDYTVALVLKEKLLPGSSRQVAEAHYKLSMVLDLTSGRLGDAIRHAECALESIEARLEELEAASNSTSAPAPAAVPKGKGKGKLLLGDDAVAGLSTAQRESETKELKGLREDLALKVEELKTRPDEPMKNASVLVAQALDAELNANAGANGAGGSGSGKVNDLTSMVVKKKKKPAEAVAEGSGSVSPTKRKADGDEEGGKEGKKVRLDGEPEP